MSQIISNQYDWNILSYQRNEKINQENIMYNQLLISLQIEEKWHTFRLFLGILSCYYLHLIKPKNYDENKEYPVVFFMHGFLGNWKLYTGVLKGLEDCIVLCVGTHTWSGIYTKNDINALFKKQIPFLENMGYKVDKNNLHIMGLSNGGSAVNVAYNGYSNKFKTITFKSTGIHQSYSIASKVLLIGGGKDH